MAGNNTDAAAKLKKLGQRIRDGIAKRHPIARKSLDTIRQTVRDEWQREQTAKRSKPIITRTKTRDRKPGLDKEP
jgi:hypothetical protein